MDTEFQAEGAEGINNLLETLRGFHGASCFVHSYTVSHGQLTIRVTPTIFGADDTFFLHLDMVSYFEGPLRWTGADFRFGTKDEAREVLRKSLRLSSEEEEDEYLSHNFW